AILRITPGGRQEIVAKVYEDTRGILVLTIQRYRRDSGIPISEHFSFIGNEINILREFLNTVQLIDIPSDGKSRFEDSKLMEDIAKVRSILAETSNLDVLIELAQNQINKADVVSLGYRTKKLNIFIDH